MASLIEDDLDSVYRNLIFLTYNNKCLFEQHPTIECNGELRVANVMTKKNKYFRWDLNNGLLLCESHAKYWSDGGREPYQFLNLIAPDLIDFNLLNRSTIFDFKPDLEALKSFLCEIKNEAIQKGSSPFPTLYGKFDV